MKHINYIQVCNLQKLSKKLCPLCSVPLMITYQLQWRCTSFIQVFFIASISLILRLFHWLPTRLKHLREIYLHADVTGAAIRRLTRNEWHVAISSDTLHIRHFLRWFCIVSLPVEAWPINRRACLASYASIHCWEGRPYCLQREHLMLGILAMSIPINYGRIVGNEPI